MNIFDIKILENRIYISMISLAYFLFFRKYFWLPRSCVIDETNHNIEVIEAHFHGIKFKRTSNKLFDTAKYDFPFSEIGIITTRFYRISSLLTQWFAHLWNDIEKKRFSEPKIAFGPIPISSHAVKARRNNEGKKISIISTLNPRELSLIAYFQLIVWED